MNKHRMRSHTAFVLATGASALLLSSTAARADPPYVGNPIPPQPNPYCSEFQLCPVDPGTYVNYVNGIPAYEVGNLNDTSNGNLGAVHSAVPCTNYDVLSPQQLAASPDVSVNQPLVDDASYSLGDPEAVGAVTLVGAAVMTVNDCVDGAAGSGVGTSGAGTGDTVNAENITFHPLRTALITAGGAPVVGAMVSPTTSGYAGFDKNQAGPDYFDHVNTKPVASSSLTAAQIGYSKDGSNVIESDFAYDSTVKDRRGRLLLFYNNMDISIGSSTNLYTARENTREFGGPTTIFPGAGASSPINSQQTQDTAGYTVSASVGISSAQGPSANAGISKEFGHSYSTIDGFNYIDQNNNNHVYEHDGGYRSIATNHHNESRSAVEMAAWIYPPGVDQKWQYGYALTIKQR